jgi:DNA-binding FadR family transcriptional regulator
MDVIPITRAAVSDAVFGQLVDEILSGRLAPEDTLPGERELAEAFGVNRHALREALKRLQQAGLIRIAQGGKTRVLDWRQHAGLDVLSKLAAAGTVPAASVLHDIAVMRRSIAADAAGLCAIAATDQQVAAITAAAAAYDGGIEADLAFWTAIIDGSDNLAYRLGLNTLVAAFTDLGYDHILEIGLGRELADLEAHRRLAAAIADRDPDLAQSLAHELLSRSVDASTQE